MKWVTRERVKVDRVACPWLIKKFGISQFKVVIWGHLSIRNVIANKIAVIMVAIFAESDHPMARPLN